MISDIKPPEIEIHFLASRSLGGLGALTEYQRPRGLVWPGLSVVSVSLPLPGPTAVFSLSSCSEG